MKKNIYLIILFIGLILPNAACDDGLNDYLEDFSTILYFRNSGEQALTLYKTGVNTDYELVVCKAGSDPQGSAVVCVEVMNEAQLMAYNSSYHSDYKLLPSSCYSFEKSELSFSSAYSYKRVPVSLDAEQIEEHIGTDATYVIPFIMYSNTDSVNVQKQHVFLAPTVQTIIVGFGKTGFWENTFADNEGTLEISLPINIPVSNLWENLSCEIEIDEDLLREYNEENSKSIRLISQDAYTIEVKPFALGESSTSVSIKIDKSKLSWGIKALPLRIKSMTNPNFIVKENESSCIVGINRTFPRKDLKLIPLSLDMLSSNSIQGSYDGTGLEGLFDGRGRGKHYHSSYTPIIYDPVYYQYIDFKLPNAINHFAYNLWTRFENTMGAPKKTIIYVGNDGETWTELGKVTNDFLPTWDEGDKEYNSVVFSSDTPFSYVRMTILECNNGATNSKSWNCGEIEIYGK